MKRLFRRIACLIHGHEFCCSQAYMRLTCADCGKVLRFWRFTRP